MNTRTHSTAEYLSIAVTALICLWLAVLMRDYTSDDALIYYRYIRNCLEGNGLVYNVGERFNGLTSPLYTYLSLAVSLLVPLSIPYTQIALGGLCFFLTCILLLPLFRDFLPRTVLLLSPPLLASSVYFYKTFGLETPLLLMLVLSALLCFARQHYTLLAIVCTLLLLTRGESLFLVIALAGTHLLLKRPQPSWRVWVIPTIILAIHFSFTLWYYGALLPNTLSAKIQQSNSGLWGTLAFMHHSPNFCSWFFGDNSLLLACLVALAVLGLLNARRNITMRIMVAFLLMYCAFYITLNIPDYFWYYGCVFLGFYLLIFWGLAAIDRLLGAPRNRIIQFCRSPAIICTALLLLLQQLAVSYTTLNGLQGHIPYKVMGEWIRDNTEPDAQVACIEIGHIGWYSRRHIIDILGLVNPYNATFIGKRDFDSWLYHYSPDYILAWEPLRPHEASVRTLRESGRYYPFHDFDFDGWQFVLLRRNDHMRKQSQSRAPHP